MKPVALYYLSLLPTVQEVARAHGYAIALHGSCERDFDLLAAPWTRDAKRPRELAEAIRQAVHGHWKEGLESGEFFMRGSPGLKPHGRLCWCIHLGAGAYIDLSVAPRLSDCCWLCLGTGLSPGGTCMPCLGSGLSKEAGGGEITEPAAMGS